MIVAVFITCRDRKHSSREHLSLWVQNVPRVTGIGNHLVDRIEQPKSRIDLSQQQEPRIRGDRAAVEVDFYGTPAQTFQNRGVSFTLCHRESLGLLALEVSYTPMFTGSMALALGVCE